MSNKRTVTIYQAEEAEADLATYYCLRCGKKVLVVTEALASRPRRSVDGSFVVLNDTIKSANVRKGPVVSLLRARKGAEKQYRMACRACGVAVGYRSQDIEDVKCRLSYIFPGILSSNPAVTLDSLEAKELAVPQCVSNETVTIDSTAAKLVTVQLLVTFNAHTRIQVPDITAKHTILQLDKSLEGNAVKINESIVKFFSQLLEKPRAEIQLLSGQQDVHKVVGIQKITCGFLFHCLLSAMLDMQYVLPRMYDTGDDTVSDTQRKRKRDDT
ncbi:UPF0235 protein [Diplonema papillatum]|nr:UPF0235 protein [Diplonema papillatum]